MILRGGKVYTGGGFIDADVRIADGVIADIAPGLSADGGAQYDCSGSYILPGLVDVHVHLREPGFSYKETIRTGSLAAARGGYTALCAMPNLSPVPDCMQSLSRELELIGADAAVKILPYASITRGEQGAALSDMRELAPYVAGFSDDGHGVASGDIMRAAMLQAAALGRVIAAHCEDMSAPEPQREWREAERNIALAEETGCALHICHVSKSQTLELIRRGKARGADITCETAPHYLLLDDTMIYDDGRFKMNPPIGTPEDRDALLCALRDGTLDMIATDHAPHSAGEKSRGLAGSLSGIVGLETAFPALYTGLVEGGEITLTRLTELMSRAPARRFVPGGGEIAPGARADIAVFNLTQEYTIDSSTFLSLGRSTPFDGRKVRGRCIMTLSGGNIVWEEKNNA